MESLTAVRARVEQMQEKENEAYRQVEQGIILVEQAQLDRTEVKIDRFGLGQGGRSDILNMYTGVAKE